MKYLLFDQNAISQYVGDFQLQSVEYQDGTKFIEHICGLGSSEVFHNTMISYRQDGILFVGRKKDSSGDAGNKHIFCIDLTTCNIYEEKENPARLLTIMQKAFRLAIKIWNRNPFSASERINETKSILFPFSISDRHRLVIERSNHVPRLESRDIVFPLLAYKYNAEDPGQSSDTVSIDVLRQAGEEYSAQRHFLHNLIKESDASAEHVISSNPMGFVSSDVYVGRDDFIFWDYENQISNLTESQRKIVDNPSIDSPIRVSGAAGTGKTMSLILRAYRLLQERKKQSIPFHVYFFAHSESTSQRNREVFALYKDSDYFLNQKSEQSIVFTTLLSFCTEFSHIDETSLIEVDASDSKSYQLLLIDDVLSNAINTNRIKTYKHVISEDLAELFDPQKTAMTVLINMLQHEFSIQIKGRTDCTIESYLELPPIPNGIPCKNRFDKELIFTLFTDYQNALSLENRFDVDDVTIEAISRLNAPIWRRKRQTLGFDYIFVDEMHLFNLNEQSVFHHLCKDSGQKNIPICFALDYSQAIGDRGDTGLDYLSSGIFANGDSHNLYTLFRNSPQIADFCAAIAASGTLMFGETFVNPYENAQYNFTSAEESKMRIPQLHMFPNDEMLVRSLPDEINQIIEKLQCKPKDIAIVAFDEKWLSKDAVYFLEKCIGRNLCRLNTCKSVPKDQCILASPFEINGMEFQAVVLVGVDEGRLPQTYGTSDISQHFIMYSAYNMLYLAVSRAKYHITILGSDTNGISSCLEHAINAGTIEVQHYTDLSFDSVE